MATEYQPDDMVLRILVAEELSVLRSKINGLPEQEKTMLHEPFLTIIAQHIAYSRMEADHKRKGFARRLGILAELQKEFGDAIALIDWLNTTVGRCVVRIAGDDQDLSGLLRDIQSALSNSQQNTLIDGIVERLQNGRDDHRHQKNGIDQLIVRLGSAFKTQFSIATMVPRYSGSDSQWVMDPNFRALLEQANSVLPREDRFRCVSGEAIIKRAKRLRRFLDNFEPGRVRSEGATEPNEHVSK